MSDKYNEQDEILVGEIERLRSQLQRVDRLRSRQSRWVSLRVLPPMAIAIAMSSSFVIAGTLSPPDSVSVFWIAFLLGQGIWLKMLAMVDHSRWPK